MATMETRDHTIGFNMGGTWVELSAFAEEFDVPVEDIENSVADMELDWIGDDLSSRAEALLREELVDIYGNW